MCDVKCCIQHGTQVLGLVVVMFQFTCREPCYVDRQTAHDGCDVRLLALPVLQQWQRLICAGWP